MPIIYLSPSTQEYNPYNGGGTEEEYMNKIADAMEPYLYASGINFVRNTPQMTAASSIAASNAGNYDLHLAIHSNAAGNSAPGSVQGVEVYYYPYSAKGERAADIIAGNYAAIYPYPQKIKTVPTERLGEISKTRAPAVLIETAYHDNAQDAAWIRNNVDEIAKNLVYSLTQYFGIPFVIPQTVRTGYVATYSGNLNIRSAPSTKAPVIGKAPKGVPVTVYAQLPNWYVINYNGVTGYASSDYIVF